MPWPWCPVHTQDLPKGQQIIMWVGIVLDFVAKGTLLFELWRFAHTRHWLWFSFTTLFFVVSSGVVALYWWTHYPGAIADQVVVEVLPVMASQVEGEPVCLPAEHVQLEQALTLAGSSHLGELACAL